MHACVEPLAEAWDELADRTNAPPFLRPGWVDAWCGAFGTRSLEIVALRRSGRLAAVVPVQARRGVLSSPTNWHTVQFGLLAEDPGARRELARVLLSHRSRRVSLAFVSVEDDDVAVWTAAAQATNRRLLCRPLERSPYVRTNGSWELYLRGRDRALLKGTRRRLRRLDELGSLAFTIEDGRSGLHELLAEGFGLEAAGWKGEQGTAVLSRPETYSFYTRLAEWAAARGWLRLAFLRLDGRPIAFEYMLEHDGALYDLKGGYDPEYARFSPGILITHQILETAFAQGLARYEFLGGAERYKLSWADASRGRIVLHAWSRSSAAKIDRTILVHGRPLLKRLDFARVRAAAQRPH